MGEKINVTRSSMPSFEEYCNEIKDLWDSRWLTNVGAKHQALRAQLEHYLGVDHVALHCNGHLSLENILAAMDFPAGSEVITTPFTFVSTTNAIKRCGLTPVFCDVEPTYYTLDPQKIEALITPKTCAIVPVHVYGNLCDVQAIASVAGKHGLKVIYDAAHAFGVRCNGQGAGAFGDASMFSFHATKVFHTIEGGCVCYRDGALTEKLEMLRNFGLSGQGDCLYVGGNAKMNEFQAAMGLCNLRHIDQQIAKRKACAERYRIRLEGVPGIVVPPVQPGVQSNYAYFPVIFDGYKLDRDAVQAKLAAHDITARKYFYPLTGSFACYNSTADTPVAAYAAQRVLTLPLYADLAPEDVDRICDLILE